MQVGHLSSQSFWGPSSVTDVVKKRPESRAIPFLQLPPGIQPVNAGEVLADFIDKSFKTHCSDLNCNHRIFEGNLEVRPEFFTVQAVNRFDVTDQNNKRRNKLTLSPSSARIGPDILGDLVCIVSYHQIGVQYFLNNDSRPCVPSSSPLEERNLDDSETIEILFFKNNV